MIGMSVFLFGLSLMQHALCMIPQRGVRALYRMIVLSYDKQDNGLLHVTGNDDCDGYTTEGIPFPYQP